jgi:hypothetical protein
MNVKLTLWNYIYFEFIGAWSWFSKMPSPAATQAAARLWTQPTPPFPAPRSYRTSVEITRTLWLQTQFTRGRVREWKNGNNFVTVQNRTHVYMNFLYHKDLGNHLLQLCLKVVKHPVYMVTWRVVWRWFPGLYISLLTNRLLTTHHSSEHSREKR